MTRREAVLSALVVFVVALATRIVFASQIVFPKPEDTAYYVDVARNLVEGRGLVSDAIWSFQTPPLEFPRPAFEVWLPLPTFLAAIPMFALGATFAAAQVSSVLVGALVPVLAWRLAADVADERGLPTGRARTLAVGTGLTTAVYLPLMLHSALPDSTMPFTVLVLTACLLMSRIVRDPRGARLTDPRVIALGLVIGLTALTRNEALWLGLAWAIVAWTAGDPRPSRTKRVRLIGVAGVVAFLVFAPWMARNWIEFGSPLPGQAAANALSVTGFDIFAWNDRPTLSRYLAVGPARLLEMRVEGLIHNLFNVLMLPGLPISIIGLLALPWQWRGAALRPLVLVSALTFVVTTVFFPVSTTWGTFLHASGPIGVLIVLSALLTLDAGIARLGATLGWTRPVAWLGPLLGIFGSVLFSITLLPAFASGTQSSATLYTELGRRMALAGQPLDENTGPVIANFPIWMAWAERVSSLALPAETPKDVLDLAAAFPGTRLVVVIGEDHGAWPAILDTGMPGADCFAPVDLGPPLQGATPDRLEDVRVYVIGCR